MKLILLVFNTGIINLKAKTLWLFLLFILLNSCSSYGLDTVEIEQGIFGKDYYYNKTELKKNKDFYPLYSKFGSSYKQFRDAKILRVFEVITGVPGYYSLGCILGSLILSRNPPDYYTGISIGCIASSLPFGIVAKIKMRKAAEAYNKEINKFNVSFQFEF